MSKEFNGLSPYEDYKKLMKDYLELLEKYNSVFEWIARYNLRYITHAEEAKKDYEEEFENDRVADYI